MVKITIEVKENRALWDRILIALGAADDLSLAWGIFKGSIAAYAIHNEYGAPKANIPSRPFLRTSTDNNQAKYSRILARAYSNMLATGQNDWTNTLNQLGVRARTDVIRNIMQGSWTPNREGTIKAKKSTRPLVDTGAMRNAIEWAIGKGRSFT